VGVGESSAFENYDLRIHLLQRVVALPADVLTAVQPGAVVVGDLDQVADAKGSAFQATAVSDVEAAEGVFEASCRTSS
jgi:hypothetical protein